MGRGRQNEGAGSSRLAAQIAKVPSQVKTLRKCPVETALHKLVISPLHMMEHSNRYCFSAGCVGPCEKAHRKTWLMGWEMLVASFLAPCLGEGRSWGWRCHANPPYHPRVLVIYHGCHFDAFCWFSTLLALYVLTTFIHHILYCGVSPNALWLPLHIKPSVCYSPSHCLYQTFFKVSPGPCASESSEELV